MSVRFKKIKSLNQYKEVSKLAEFSAVLLQNVATSGNVLFTDTTSPCNRGYVIHRTGSGQFTLRGCTANCRAKYRVDFNGNIAVPDGGTAGEISLAIALNGEADLSTQAIVTPSSVGTFNNVSFGTDLWIPKGCCFEVSIKNVSDQPIDVQNANVTINRIG